MSIETVGVLVGWIGCGIIAYGLLYADFHGHVPNSHPREGTGLSAFIAVLGPVGLVIALISTDFGMHGLRFTKQERKKA